MKLTQIIRTVLIIFPALCLVACDPGTTGTGMQAQTSSDTEESTALETAAPEVILPEMMIESAALAEGVLTVTASFTEDLEGQVIALCGEKEIPFVNSYKTENCPYSFEIPTGSDSFSITLRVLTAEGEEADSLSLVYENGLPQLTPDTVELVINEMTDMEKASLCFCLTPSGIYALSGITYEIERLGVPGVTLSDGPAGARVSAVSIGYPVGNVLAQTWNTELVEELIANMGDDCVDFGVDVLLGPGMNIQRTVLGGRNFEYYSEDPMLTGKIAAAYVNGIQSTGTMACVKHFAVNNYETHRGSSSSNVSERALREIYLKAFEYVNLYSDPATLMTSYNRVNKTFSAVNADLIEGVLRSEMGFSGCVFSDWGASGGRVGMINAGNDLSCGFPDVKGDIETIYKGIVSGKISEGAIDSACRNILNMAARSMTYKGNVAVGRVSDSNEKREAVRAAAAEGMVLLKNENGALPFAKGSEIALFGTGSYHTETCGKGSGDVSVKSKVSIYMGMKRCDDLKINEDCYKLYRNCKAPVVTNTVNDNPENDTTELVITDDRLESIAKEASAGVFTVTRLTCEGVDHLNRKGDFCLNDREADMIKRASAAFHSRGKPFVVIINTGNPIETASWRDLVDAILYCGYAGETAGLSVCDVLSGKSYPSGKLTCTWPAVYTDAPESDYFPGSADSTLYYEDIYVGYRYYETFDVDVAYEFGFGLSYTDFEYSDFTLTQTGALTYKASVKVTNTGKRAGKEIVQFYITKPEAEYEQPIYQLCGFGKTKELKPGESETVTAVITAEEMEIFLAKDADWAVEAGEYTISVGKSVKDIKASGRFTVENRTVTLKSEHFSAPARELNLLTKETGRISFENRENIALGKRAFACGQEGAHIAKYACDGDSTTRWSGAGSARDGVYFWIVDLGKNYDLDAVRVRWESNTAEEYSIYCSDDGVNWTLHSKNAGDSVTVASLKGVNARYIKLEMPAVQWCSIYECEIFEDK